MLQRANERIREGYSSEYVEPEKPIEWNRLVKYARKGDSMCLDILNDSAKFLGYAAAYIINTLNPEAVVIGKCFKQYSFLVIDVLTETAMKKALPYPASKAVIMVSDYGMNSSALGAAMIPIRKVFGK
jgi:predicted NBD/HSP70 family sugar kinase